MGSRRHLLKFLSQNIDSGIGRLGVCELSDGVAVAQVARPEGPDPELVFCEFLPLERSGGAAGLLRKMISSHQLERFRTVGVMPPGSYSLLQIEPPEVPETELREAVRWQIKDLIDFSLEESVVDVFSVPVPRRPGRPRIAYAVATRASRVRQTVEMLKHGRLQIEAIDIPELVLRNIAAHLPENPQGVAILHIDAHQGQLAIIQNSVLYLTRNLGGGLSQLVRPEAGSDFENDLESSSLLRSLAETVTMEIRRSLDFFESHFALSPIESLVVLPLEREIPDLVPALQSQLTLKIRSLDLNALLKGPGIPMELQSRCLLAIGGALRTGSVKP